MLNTLTQDLVRQSSRTRKLKGNGFTVREPCTVYVRSETFSHWALSQYIPQRNSYPLVPSALYQQKQSIRYLFNQHIRAHRSMYVRIPCTYVT